ncbi:hypothetical protein ebA2085 [Aromatoleum aromaticum EbN1]|uniref:Uncharacterized protein n=1 Tax=Aromatoleum aromaticum (strain DSM 19018 / LMG 30748 / EbN1) TaxID=76114 RepID=Q5P5Y5_AROAE|nr:hypothetical protein ebA2085 [Aromatoleum aromaticum EbN1]
MLNWRARPCDLLACVVLKSDRAQHRLSGNFNDADEEKYHVKADHQGPARHAGTERRGRQGDPCVVPRGTARNPGRPLRGGDRRWDGHRNRGRLRNQHRDLRRSHQRLVHPVRGELTAATGAGTPLPTGQRRQAGQGSRTCSPSGRYISRWLTRPPWIDLIMDSSAFCVASSLGSRSPCPPRQPTNTMSQGCPRRCDSSTSSAKLWISSVFLSTYITGASAPPWPFSKRRFSSGVAPSGSSARAKTNSSRCGSGCCRAASRRLSNPEMTIFLPLL